MKRDFRKGAFTIEAAIVTSLICLVIAAFIYQTFLLHDRALLQSLSVGLLEKMEMQIASPVFRTGELDEKRFQEMGVLERSRTVEYIDVEEEKNRFLETVRQKTFLISEMEVEMNISRSEVRLKCFYQFELPQIGIIRLLLGENLPGESEYVRRVSIPGRQIVRVGRGVSGK